MKFAIGTHSFQAPETLSLIGSSLKRTSYWVHNSLRLILTSPEEPVGEKLAIIDAE